MFLNLVHDAASDQIWLTMGKIEGTIGQRSRECVLVESPRIVGNLNAWIGSRLGGVKINVARFLEAVM